MLDEADQVANEVGELYQTQGQDDEESGERRPAEEDDNSRS